MLLKNAFSISIYFIIFSKSILLSTIKISSSALSSFTISLQLLINSSSSFVISNLILICLNNEYKIQKIILFGSSSISDDYNDIDLGIKGIKPELFFEFYGKLIYSLSKPFDIVILDEKSKFNDMIEKYGITIYD